MGGDTCGTECIGCCWVVLVLGTFGVGFAMWGTGCLFVFGSWELAPLVSATYMFGALSQLAAGCSMWLANWAIKDYVKAMQRRAAELELSEVLGAASSHVNLVCYGCG